jgi:hypothetical protein
VLKIAFLGYDTGLLKIFPGPNFNEIRVEKPILDKFPLVSSERKSKIASGC